MPTSPVLPTNRPWTFAEFLRRSPVLVQQHVCELGFAVEYFPRYVNLQPKMHSPGVVLLSFILRGEGRHLLGDEVVEEHGGSLAVTHYGQFHSIITDAAGMEIMNVYLDLDRIDLPTLPGELQRILPEILPLHPVLLHRQNRMVRLVFDDRETIAALLFGLHDELAACHDGYREAAACYLKLLFMACCRQALRSGVVPFLGSAPREGDQRMEELRRRLDVHYAEPQTLAELAQRAGMTPTALCRAFKAYTGVAPIDYLLHRRIQEVLLRLRSGTEKISQIALDSGFNDLSHFNHTFKTLIGVTPRAYRARQGREHER